MSRPPFFSFALVLLAAVTATTAEARTSLRVNIFAQTPDTQSVDKAPFGADIVFNIPFGWGGDEVPQNLVLEAELPGEIGSIRTREGTPVSCTGTNPLRCEIPTNAVQGSDTLFVTTKQTTSGRHRLKVRLSTTTPRTATATVDIPFEVTGLPDLNLDGVFHVSRGEPSGPGASGFSLYNYGATATNVKLTFTLPGGGTFTRIDVDHGTMSCEVEPSQVICDAGVIEFRELVSGVVHFRIADALEGGEVVLRGVLTADQADLNPADNTMERRGVVSRHLLVTNTNDEGGGSLRQALLDADVFCKATPCVIDFRIPPPAQEGGWFTIRPRTTLPPVTGFVKIDGATQKKFGGDTNPDGPEIEINGSLLSAGDGLFLTSACEQQVLDLTINGFPRHAIEIDRANQPSTCASFSHHIVANNYLGTDPRGLVAVPNERGVVISDSSWSRVENNLISGNRRAGIFAGGGYHSEIRGNRIGVAADGSPMGNGAAGVFVNIGLPGPGGFPGGADVERNVIAYNGHWGVCRTRNGEVAIVENSIFGNTFYGIDTDLDFETPNVPDDSRDKSNKPVLFSADFDVAAGKTIVRGRLDSRPISSLGTFEIHVYASSGLSRWGHAQGETFVGKLTLLNGRTDFEIAVDGDLRGKFITATNTRSYHIGFSHYNRPRETSEFSNVIVAR